MTDELRERLNAVRALSAFASSEDVQWLVDRVEEAEARAADLADRELTALRTMEKAIKELADHDAKLAAVEVIHTQRTANVYSAHHHDVDHDLEDERCTDECFEDWTLCNGDGTAWPCSTARALSLSVPTSPVDRCEQCGDDRAISAGPNCTEPNDHYPSEDTYTDEQIGRLVKAIDLPNDERNQRLEQDDFWADPPSTSPEQDKQR